MKSHLGALLTSGLAALALALALLQAVIVARGVRHSDGATAVRSTPSNRYSAPGGRSGVRWMPFDEHKTPEGRTPASKPEEHRSPPPRDRVFPPPFGPHPARRVAA